ncbi:hypothetical protein KOI35_19945 [Actinoplanes bogorensis]|uniref:Uncharacterized protein n=1 Tax=Paractinoplanes bogorensis TaxID=1610840 RepID=A0ABS5YQQ3_9ACTN|nr:hypothetical protein [Actinoplanes bogorensis]MBU2665786.1 hypothetical protein [Actinoplanes bogorensis]
MVTTSRVVWFAIAFAFALPIMALMFRNGAEGRPNWIQAALFAGAMALIVTVFFGKGRR